MPLENPDLPEGRGEPGGDVGRIADTTAHQTAQDRREASSMTPDTTPQTAAPELQTDGIGILSLESSPSSAIDWTRNVGEAKQAVQKLRATGSAVRRGWSVPPEAIADAIETARIITADPTANRRAKLRAGALLRQFVQLDQEDLHHRERLDAEQGIVRLKMERAEQGLANDLVAIAPGAQQLPLPPYLAGKARLLASTQPDTDGTRAGEGDKGQGTGKGRKDGAKGTTSSTTPAPDTRHDAPG